MNHANIIISREECRDYVFDILEKDLNFNIKANPDFLLVETESFSIDHARDLIKWSIGKALVGEIKVSLIIVKSITLEAQNALLKILEESPEGTFIFISLENLGGILPTLVSRVRILNLHKEVNNLEDDAQKFFSSKIKDKLSVIRTLSKKEDKSDIKELIKNLEQIAYQNKASANHIKNVLTAKIFASTRGSSPKMLLEWLSAVL